MVWPSRAGHWSPTISSAGRLMCPFPRIAKLATGLAYYIVARRTNLARPEVKSFCEWIRTEARELSRAK